MGGIASSSYGWFVERKDRTKSQALQTFALKDQVPVSEWMKESVMQAIIALVIKLLLDEVSKCNAVNRYYDVFLYF